MCIEMQLPQEAHAGLHDHDGAPYKSDSDQLSTTVITYIATGLRFESKKTRWSPWIRTLSAITDCKVICGNLKRTRNLLSAIVDCDAH
jgi:hypothetical protein